MMIVFLFVFLDWPCVFGCKMCDKTREEMLCWLYCITLILHPIISLCLVERV